MEQVILVDEKDTAIGSLPKMEAHEKGLLHRAFSVFIFNSAGEMLLQQRAAHKYHSPGLWSNSCCSHPRPGEATKDAAMRRLQEEMGFSTPLEKAFDFIYKTTFDNGLTEHEFDHVFIGYYNGTVLPDQAEVSDYAYYAPGEIETALENEADRFTTWFQIAFPKVKEWWKSHRSVQGE